MESVEPSFPKKLASLWYCWSCAWFCWLGFLSNGLCKVYIGVYEFFVLCTINLPLVILLLEWFLINCLHCFY
ncbi:unnamed protein product, partial [Prunus brigantina]